MELTLKERIILANQYRILEALIPEEAETYATLREAIQKGFTLEYDDMLGAMYKEEMSEQQCNEVIDIVDMYRHLKESYDELPDKSGISAGAVRFPGFDGNDSRESHCASYVRHMVNDGRWSELADHNGDFNSHMPMLNRYRQMLQIHKQYDRVKALDKEQILNIIPAYVNA